MSSYLFTVFGTNSSNRKLRKHDPADGSVISSYTTDSSHYINFIALNGSDGNILVTFYNGSSHEISYVSQDTLSQQWRVSLSGFIFPNIFANGDLMVYDGDATVERRDTADGSLIASYNTEDTVTNAVDVEPASDNGWFTFGYAGDKDKVAKYDSTGTEVWAVEHPDSGYNNNVQIQSVVGGPNGGCIIGGDETIVRFDSTGSVLWNTTINYVTFESLKIDDSGHVVGMDLYDRDIRQLNLSDGTVATAADEPDGDGVNKIAVEKNGEFYSAARNGITRYDNTGSVVYQVQTSREVEFGLERFPNYTTHPGSWITEVTKSASSSKVASSTTQNTASGSVVADASASVTGSQSTLNTASATSTATPQATVTASSATPQTAAPTTTATPDATTVASTTTMHIVDTSVPVSATGVASTTTMHTADTSVPVSATTVTSSSSMQTPSTITTSTAPVSDFGYVENSGGVFKYDIDGTVQWSITSINAHTIATDSAGNVYAADTSSSTLYAYDSTGAEKWNVPLTILPNRLDVGEDGALYAIDSGSPSSIEQFGTATGASQWTDTWSHEVASTTLDAAGRLYIGSRDGRVRRWDNDGTVAWTRDFGADFRDPVDVVENGSGSLFAHTLEDDGAGGRLPSVRQLDSADGSTSATKSIGYNPLYEFAVDDESNLYLAGGNDPVTIERYDYATGTSEWTIGAGYAVRDLDVTTFGTLYALVSPTFSGSTELRRYDASDGSLDVTLDTVFGSLAFYPDYASNQTAWTPQSRASVTASITPTTTVMESPTSTAGVSASSSPVAADGGTAVAGATGTAFTVATQTTSTASPQAPSGVATGQPSATTVAASASMFTPTSDATGASRIDVSATTVAASASMFTPSTSASATVEPNVTVAEAGPLSSPVSTDVAVSSNTHSATSTMNTAELAVVVGASSVKHGATASTLTALEFERRIRELGSGPNGSSTSPSKNSSELLKPVPRLSSDE